MQRDYLAEGCGPEDIIDADRGMAGRLSASSAGSTCVLEVARWQGHDWSPWKELKRGDIVELSSLAHKEARRLCYNFKARIIQIHEEINT